MTLAKEKKYIQCKSCGKTIEQKGNREYCIRCRNQLDKERNKTYQYKYKEESTDL